MKISVLGPKGTFSDVACLEYQKSSSKMIDVLYYFTIEEAVKALNDKADLCIVPIENSLDGYVQLTLDLLLEEDIKIVDEILIPIQFKLIGNVTSIDKVEKLYVQFKAKGQCRKTISKVKNAHIISTDSNMISFERVLKGIKGEASIVPSHINHEGVNLLVSEATDSKENFTRFIVLSKKGENNLNHSDKIRIPIFVVPKKDRPGMLFEILKEFAINKINLTSIMSRPTKKKLGNYNFYIEIEAFAEDYDIIIETLNVVDKEFDVKVLGIYTKRS